MSAVEQSIGLVGVAREALDECGGDRAAALLLLRRWFAEDRQLYDRLIEPMIDDACDAALRAADQRLRLALQRQTSASPPTPLHPRTPRAVVAPLDRGVAGIVAKVERTLLDYPLPGGKPLGDATPADLLEAARYYRDMERTHRREATWFELIHAAMQGGSRVGQVLPVATLERLRRQAEEG